MLLLLLLLLLEPLLEALARGGRRPRSRFRFFRALPKPAVLHAFRFGALSFCSISESFVRGVPRSRPEKVCVAAVAGRSERERKRLRERQTSVYVLVKKVLCCLQRAITRKRTRRV